MGVSVETPSRKTYNFFSYYGRLNIYYDLDYIFDRILEDTFVMPRRKKLCNKKGHKWYSPIEGVRKVCSRCYESENS